MKIRLRFILCVVLPLVLMGISLFYSGAKLDLTVTSFSGQKSTIILTVTNDSIKSANQLYVSIGTHYNITKHEFLSGFKGDLAIRARQSIQVEVPMNSEVVTGIEYFVDLYAEGYYKQCTFIL